MSILFRNAFSSGSKFDGLCSFRSTHQTFSQLPFLVYYWMAPVVRINDAEGKSVQIGMIESMLGFARNFGLNQKVTLPPAPHTVRWVVTKSDTVCSLASKLASVDRGVTARTICMVNDVGAPRLPSLEILREYPQRTNFPPTVRFMAIDLLNT